MSCVPTDRFGMQDGGPLNRTIVNGTLGTQFPERELDSQSLGHRSPPSPALRMSSTSMWYGRMGQYGTRAGGVVNPATSGTPATRYQVRGQTLHDRGLGQ